METWLHYLKACNYSQEFEEYVSMETWLHYLKACNYSQEFEEYVGVKCKGERVVQSYQKLL